MTFQDTLALTYEPSLDPQRKFLIILCTCDKVERQHNQADKMYHMEATILDWQQQPDLPMTISRIPV